MYNMYELLWLWYYYHSEKVDLIVGDVVSRDDNDCKIPVTASSRRVSNDHANNLKKIMRGVCGGDSSELNNYRNIFFHYKNKAIFEEYEHLDEQGEFQFIHDYVNRKLERKNRKYPDDEIFIF